MHWKSIRWDQHAVSRPDHLYCLTSTDTCFTGSWQWWYLWWRSRVCCSRVEIQSAVIWLRFFDCILEPISTNRHLPRWISAMIKSVIVEHSIWLIHWETIRWYQSVLCEVRHHCDRTPSDSNDYKSRGKSDWVWRRATHSENAACESSEIYKISCWCIGTAILRDRHWSHWISVKMKSEQPEYDVLPGHCRSIG